MCICGMQIVIWEIEAFVICELENGPLCPRLMSLVDVVAFLFTYFNACYVAFCRLRNCRACRSRAIEKIFFSL